LSELAAKTRLQQLPLVSRLPVRAKVDGFRALGLARHGVARFLRAIPGSWRFLGLPSRRIRSLKNWIQQQRAALDWMDKCKGTYYDALFAPVPVSRHPPQNALGETHHHAFTVERYHVHNEVYLARIPRGRVLGPDGTVILPDGGIVEESVWGQGWLGRDRSLTALRLPRPEFKLGSYFTVATPFSEGFAHWVLDVLPRFYSLGRLPADDMRILVAKPLNSWQRESLELLGIDASRIEVLGPNYVAPEILYFPSFVGDPGNEHRDGMQWLRDKLLGNFASARKDRRLYISRRLAARRRILNEAELYPILHDHGFEIVEAERMSFRDQVELLSQTEAVVSLHGAGLSNILFAARGCKVLEIFDPDHVKVMYWALADVLEHEYWYCIGQKTAHTAGQHQATGHDDVIIPPAEFAHALTRIFGK